MAFERIAPKKFSIREASQNTVRVGCLANGAGYFEARFYVSGDIAKSLSWTDQCPIQLFTGSGDDFGKVLVRKCQAGDKSDCKLRTGNSKSGAITFSSSRVIRANTKISMTKAYFSIDGSGQLTIEIPSEILAKTNPPIAAE